MTFAPTRFVEDAYLEKRVIVGSLALEVNADLAETARQLLEVPDSTAECLRLTTGLRQLFFGPADDAEA
jgi:hypothetical protein